MKSFTVVAPGAFLFHLLVHHARRHRPVVAEVDAQRRACTKRVGRVVVVLREFRVVDDGVVSRIGCIARIDAGRFHVVDPARIVLRPTHEPDGRAVAHRDVDEAFGDIAGFVAVDHIAFERIAGREAGRIGRVRDDADGARLRACAIERALRACERLDARDVVQVNVEVTADGRDRLFIQVGADARLRGDRLAVAAGRDAAHVDEVVAAAGLHRLLRLHRRQVLRVLLEVLDVQLFDRLIVDGIQADRNVLEVFGALLRRDDNFAEGRGGLLLRHHGRSWLAPAGRRMRWACG